MAIFLPTTTITVKRPAADVDPDESETLTTVFTGVRAHISSPSGSDRRSGGDQELVDAIALFDVVDVHHEDVIFDDETGESWDVSWVRRRRGLGLDHMKAGLFAAKGASVG